VNWGALWQDEGEKQKDKETGNRPKREDDFGGAGGLIRGLGEAFPGREWEISGRTALGTLFGAHK
jgi:hypothetical protein